MKLRVLVFLTSALIATYESTGMRSEGIGHPESIIISDLSKLGQNPMLEQREVDERSFSEDDRICFFLTEKDTESQISCKHRLTRSKFNYNPFGLRFGKRDELLKSDKKRRVKKLLPLLLFIGELKEAS
ncbi:kisspeptin 2 [Trichomycterus rosablanca]|uniref:kisspeptin 2 n=1 Tax=Trichomycterus rosablanca TaxID=2290929 RepID=UPI002F356441